MKTTILSLPLFAASALFAGTAMEGVTFIPGGIGNGTCLLGPTGTSVKTWSSVGSPYSAFLTDSGTVLYGTGNGTGPGAPYKSIAEVDWSGASKNNSWTWTSPTTGTLHHGFATMPNGHWLAIGYEYLTNAQIMSAMGVTSLSYTGTAYNEHILEYDPATKTVVWEWDAKKHFSATNDPHKINVTKWGSSSSGPGGGSSGDVMHFNSVAYDPVRDVVMVSAHMMNEILVVDHSTTTAQAATNAGGKFGKGGDILFRWGAPTNYGGTGSTICNVVHGGNAVPQGYANEGNYLFFCNSDNGVLNTSAKGISAAYEIQPVVADTGFVLSGGTYSATVAFSFFKSGYTSSGNFGFVQALPNGNRFVSFSKSGKMAEISEGAIVLEYSGASSERFRASRYPLSYKGISSLTGVYQPSTGVEKVVPVEGLHVIAQAAARTLTVGGVSSGARIRIRDMKGRLVNEVTASRDNETISTRGWSNGAYVLSVESAGKTETRGIGIFY